MYDLFKDKNNGFKSFSSECWVVLPSLIDDKAMALKYILFCQPYVLCAELST